MFKSAIVYRIAPDWTAPSLEVLEEGLERGRFAPCGASDARSAGWIEPRGRDNAALVERVDGQLILSLRTETRAVPGSAVKTALDERLQRVEDETGSRPRGKRRKELKEEVVIDLLPRAFSKFATTRVWIDPATRLMVVGAGSLARADETVVALMETFRAIGHELSVGLLKTRLSPSVAMSLWLSERDAPAGFSIDRECELKQAARIATGASGASSAGAAAGSGERGEVREGDGDATVRYARHALDIDEIVRHIEQGKVATRLAMTWQDRVSFLLDATMGLKRIEILDVVLEGEGHAQNADEDGFDADVAIATAELGRLIPDLVEALGGESDPVTDAADSDGADSGATVARSDAAPVEARTALPVE